MIKILLTILLFASVASAGDIEVTWSFPQHNEILITGYRVYDVSGNLMVNNIPAGDRLAVIYNVIECNEFYIVSVNDWEESSSSNTVKWCPKPTTPTAPDGLTITVSPLR